MNIRVEKISYENNLEDLKNFFNINCGSSSETFTYFKKRNYDTIKNHISTNIIYLNNNPCGYSHLDKEEENIWLGICIGEKFKGKGLGEILIKKTLEQALENKIKSVLLSVNKNNFSAINLYKKVGFLETRKDSLNIFMKKEL